MSQRPSHGSIARRASNRRPPRTSSAPPHGFGLRQCWAPHAAHVVGGSSARGTPQFEQNEAIAVSVKRTRPGEGRATRRRPAVHIPPVEAGGAATPPWPRALSPYEPRGHRRFERRDPFSVREQRRMTVADVCRSVPPVDPGGLTRSMAVTRLALGAGLALTPRLITAPWLGKDAVGPAATVLTRSMGARDAAIGAGLLAAIGRGGSTRGWLTAGLAADVTDLAATVVAGDELPPTAVPLITVAAGAGI